MLAACGGDTDLGAGPAEPPARLEVVSGDGQSGPVGEALEPVVVRVTDAAGGASAGIEVRFQAAHGSLSPAAVRTNADGVAASFWTLGTAAGPQAATATVAALPPLTLSARATAGPPVSLAFTQAPAGAVAGVPLDPEVRVLVQDAYGNTVPSSHAGVTVTLNHGALEGNATGPAEEGVASFPGLHIDQAGTGYSLTAASPSLAEAHSPPFDVATGSATEIAVRAGTGQTAAAGSAVPVPPSVVVRDGTGNAVVGVVVAFAVTGGGGTVSPARVTTGDDGTAAVDRWTLGETAGENRLDAAIAANPSASVAFSATGVAGQVDAGQSTLTADPATIESGGTTTLRVVARDGYGNPVAGAPVHLAASGSGNALSQPSSTDAQGRASGTLTASGAGDRTVTADVATVTLPGVTVQVTAPRTVASVQVRPGADTLLAGQELDLVAVALDGQGQPIDGAPIDWSSSRPGVASVSGGGRVTALKPGSATISARSGTRTGTAAIEVSYGPGTVTGLPYCTMDGVTERMDVYVPAAGFARPLPAVVHVHGGGWVSGSRTRGVWFAEMLPALLDRGFLVASVDYRLAPTHKYPAQIQDVKCAIRHLRANALRYGLGPDAIGVIGSSAGGQLAGLLGTTDVVAGLSDVGDFPGVSSRAQAVVALSPITDFTTIEELRDDYSRVFPTWPDPDSPELIQASPLTHVTADDSPFFFVAGEQDTLVLPAQSARMHRRLLDAGVPSSLVMIRNANHGLTPETGPLDPTQADVIGRLLDFLDRHLR